MRERRLKEEDRQDGEAWSKNIIKNNNNLSFIVNIDCNIPVKIKHILSSEPILFFMLLSNLKNVKNISLNRKR